ncbi:Piso0_001236 [Millerozyma farinosa CBS 7064]|uniref:Geranylgeranyl transferase type-2 subunit alpha n=1 Tax=Pichia sorbitophila (strain ATCC MYA-4447 / BCRC 22081 / CBS 7064 / NBRC 10061 / NRRL Y-12695) TaxID=559304 RepID=G8YDT9_PICSO|nr:Piso0_001236 [Millerozyma farinosa CBS 7064]
MLHEVKKQRLTEEARLNKLKKDKAKIKTYRALTEEVLKGKIERQYSKHNLDLTTKLINLNPEFYTIWNYRREIFSKLFEQGDLDKKETLEKDLGFSMEQLKKFPKCYWVWNHRVWCLLQLQSMNEANWMYEFGIASKLLEMDSRNFHGWYYRRFVVENMENNIEVQHKDDQQQQIYQYLSINIKEYEYTTAKISKNISNFSAWHNRSKLIPKIYDNLRLLSDKTAFSSIRHIFQSPYDILMSELNYIKTGIYMDPDDTSVWLYLYWLLLDPFYVEYLKPQSPDGLSSYVDILKSQLQVVMEVNTLEKEESLNGEDNIWCLKSILIINNVLEKETGDKSIANTQLEVLEKLIRLDPLRKGRYLDYMNGTAKIV